jgi:menaquinone-dependent protoporphyrinogen oxidase
MANVLVAFGTHDGQTRKVAERIATVLRVRTHTVGLFDLRRPPRETLDLSRFQAVLVGSPIRAQGYLRPVVRFVQSHRTELERLSPRSPALPPWTMRRPACHFTAPVVIPEMK